MNRLERTIAQAEQRIKERERRWAAEKLLKDGGKKKPLTVEEKRERARDRQRRFRARKRTLHLLP
jgi:hypothetical protein